MRPMSKVVIIPSTSNQSADSRNRFWTTGRQRQSVEALQQNLPQPHPPNSVPNPVPLRLFKSADCHRMADKILFWRIYEREPLSTLIYDRTILIGDAGHPMTPFVGQGANQALEDAGALLGLLSNLTSKEQLQDRLKLYEKVRLRRSARVQSSASTPLRNGKINPLFERKQEYEDADEDFPKDLIPLETFYYDYRCVSQKETRKDLY